MTGWPVPMLWFRWASYLHSVNHFNDTEVDKTAVGMGGATKRHITWTLRAPSSYDRQKNYYKVERLTSSIHSLTL